jgi:hypothetical protein
MLLIFRYYHLAKETTRAASVAFASVNEVEAFINEYFGVWQGTDEDLIMSYYSENVALQICPCRSFPGRRARSGGRNLAIEFGFESCDVHLESR